MNRPVPADAGRVFRPARFASVLLWLGLATAAALPVAAAAQPAGVEAAIRDARGDRGVRDFYRARGYRPLWISGAPGPEAAAVLRLLETADADGLDPGDYRPRAIAEALDAARDGTPRSIARAELLLSRRFAQYVRDVRRPRNLGMTYAEEGLAPTRPTVRAALERAAAAPSLLAYVELAGWMHPIYGALRRAYVASGGGGDPDAQVPAGPILRPGSDDTRVRALRRRLGLEPAGGYDAAVTRAVRDFQAAQGLPSDGLAGPLTLAALNRGAPDRRRLLRINLARARALPADPGRRYILVDAAAARLWAYQDGRVAETMRVVVGRVTDPTPILAGRIRYATLNPYWNVPPDLAATRVAPHVLREGPSYLRAKGFELLSGWSEAAAPLDPATVDWAAVAAGRREVRIRQRPGPENAMGRVKFSFPNAAGVYLHDTPERDLLREAARTYSAGCVRVENAQRLGRWLFGRNLRPDGRTPEQHVILQEPVPIYITYLTAAPEGDRIVFRDDVYGRDGTRLAGR